MSKADEAGHGASGGGRKFWDALSAHWFEDLPEGECLGLAGRWFIAGCGTATFFLATMLLQSSTVLSTDAEVLIGYVGISVGFILGLGFLLAWKRPRSGPVRLYMSGIALPSFILLAARAATNIGA